MNHNISEILNKEYGKLTDKTKNDIKHADAIFKSFQGKNNLLNSNLPTTKEKANIYMTLNGNKPQSSNLVLNKKMNTTRY